MEEYRPLVSGRHNMGKVMLLTLQFFLLFSTFSSTQNMIAQIFEQLGHTSLGINSLFVLYLVFGLAALVAPNIAVFKPNIVMCVSALGFTSFTATGILIAHCSDNQLDDGICDKTATYAIVMIGAILCGLGAATIWISQAWYISNLSTPETRGIYYGVFFAGMQSSQISANVLSAILLSYDQQTYFIVLTIIAALSSFSFLLLPNPEGEQASDKTVGERLSSANRILQDSQMIPLLFYYILEGAIVAFYLGFLFRIVEGSLSSTNSIRDVNVMTSYVFIVLGCAEFVGGIISGMLADKVNRYFLSSCSTNLVQLTLVISIAAYYLHSYTLCFFAAALWGLSDCIVQNLCTVISSTLFPNQVEVFAVMRLVQGVSITVNLLINAYVSEPIYVLFVVVFVEIVANVMSAKIGVKREKK